MKVIIIKIMKVHARLRGATALDNGDDHVNILKVKEVGGKGAGIEEKQKMTVKVNKRSSGTTKGGNP